VLTVVLSGVGLRAVATQVRPLLWVLVPVAALQVWLAGPVAAARVTVGLLLAVSAAAVVTLTTRTEDLLDAIVGMLRPLRRLGVQPDRVALVLALAVRTVPVLAGLGAEVRAARAARGAERSLRAFAVPFVIRSLRYADRLGEALAARGVDDA
jgi:biotin transport system permease protein